MSAGPLAPLLTGTTPRIAAPFTDVATDGDLAGARGAGLDVAEARIDLFSSVALAHVTAQLDRFAPLPVLATIRAGHEGGGWTGGDADRQALYAQVVDRVAGVDVELSSTAIVPAVVAAARAAGRTVVLSSHDFDRTPPLATLRDRVSRAREAGADYVKVATTATTAEDLRVLARLTLEEHEQGVIVVAMGPWGPASRVLLPTLGSALTYAASETASVPGQMSVAETSALLRRLVPPPSSSVC